MTHYRLYEIERGQIARHQDFHADQDADAIARARIALAHAAEVELWNMSAAPIRLVELSDPAAPAPLRT